MVCDPPVFRFYTVTRFTRHLARPNGIVIVAVRRHEVMYEHPSLINITLNEGATLPLKSENTTRKTSTRDTDGRRARLDYLENSFGKKLT